MRYAILSDIHANAQALAAVEADVQDLRNDDDLRRRPLIAYWFLGDLMGYGDDPVECIRWLRVRADIGARWVPGNHDEYLYSRCIGEGIHPDANQTLTAHLQILEDRSHSRDREWFFKAMKEFLDDNEKRTLVSQTVGPLTVSFTHAAIKSDFRRNHYLYPWNFDDLNVEFDIMQRHLPDSETNVLLCGHTHYPMWVQENEGEKPFLRSIKYGTPLPLGTGRMIINPGSVGQPRDGDPRAAYAILDMDAATIEFRRVPYAIEKAVQRLWDMIGVSGSVKKALATRLETANGGMNLANFQTVYLRPEWDLQAINK